MNDGNISAYQNTVVEEALETFTQAPSNDNRANLLNALRSGYLFIGITSLPKEWENRAVEILDETKITVLYSVVPNFGNVLLAFTSEQEIRKRNQTCAGIALEALSVLEQVLDGGFAALALNPEGSWAEINLEEIQQIKSFGNKNK